MKQIILTLIIMSSFSELDGSILRDTSNPPLTDKGSALTYAEFDGNFVKQYNAIQDIVSGENVTAYDAGATYDAYSTDVFERFASYNSRIWKAVYVGSPSSFSGQTPAEGAYWTQVSLAQMIPNILPLARMAEEIGAAQNACPAFCQGLIITSAQVLALNGTPLQIVAAPGAGYAIEVISASCKVSYGTSPYATNTNLRIITNGATDPQFDNAKVLTATATAIWKFGEIEPTTATDTQIIENAALMIDVATGNPTGGDSGIVIYVYYHIIPV